MGKKYLIDTNVLIGAQTLAIPETGLKVLGDIIDIDFTISFITYIEFLGYKFATPSMNEFVSSASIIEINRTIIDKTILIRKSKKIPLPDAIIAATALVENRILMTRNIDDFKNIDGLALINLWEV